jgi:hypothetical protein
MATGNAVRMPEPAEPEMPNLVIPTDAGASPFKLVVDPALRSRLRKALLELVDNHDQDWRSMQRKGSWSWRAARIRGDFGGAFAGDDEHEGRGRVFAARVWLRGAVGGD